MREILEIRTSLYKFQFGKKKPKQTSNDLELSSGKYLQMT